MHNHTLENQNLKKELAKYQQIFGKIPYIDDSLFKGGYRVVRNLKERDAIPYCYRKYGMKVVVVGEEETGLFREYILNSENLLNVWKEVIIDVPITEVFEETVQLTEDYSELAEDLETQRDLNLILKALILQLQQNVQNIEVPTNTSDLFNDGEDGLNPFITLEDIPPIPGQVNADWNATSGVAEILNKPTIPAPVDISGKLDKPTTDGSWVVTKSGTTITYTDASSFGQNIANTNLTWSADRTQNLNAKKLSFTGGRVSVPALELEITSENSVPNKIWTAGTYLWHTNNLGISYRVAYDNQVIKTIVGDVTLDDTYHNCIVVITATCTITVPIGLRNDFNCVFDAINSAICTFVEGSGISFSAPFGKILRDNSMCNIYKTSGSSYRLNGGLIPA